jgi:hypothetical protein
VLANDDFVRIVNMPVWISAERRTYGRQDWDGPKRGKTVDRDVWESASQDGYATLFEKLASSFSFSSRNYVCRMTGRLVEPSDYLRIRNSPCNVRSFSQHFTESPTSNSSSVGKRDQAIHDFRWFCDWTVSGKRLCL